MSSGSKAGANRNQSSIQSASTSNDPMHASKKSLESRIVEQLLEDCDVAEYESQLIPTILQLSHTVTRKILDEAKEVSQHSGKKHIEPEDADFEEKYHPVVDRQRLTEMAMEKNNKPLPTIRQNFGMRLPNDRFCLVQPNYQVSSRSIQILSQRERVDNYIMAGSSMDTSYEIRPEQVVGSILGKRKASMDEYD